MSSYISDANKGTALDAGDTRTGRLELSGRHVEIQMGAGSRAHDSPLLTSSITPVPSESILRSTLNLKIAAVCL